MYYGLINSMNRASASGYPINLKVYLDAGNTLSYSGSGINWYDLTTNANNATLINGVGYNSANRGSLTFNGVNQYCTIPNNSGFKFGSGDFYIGQFVNFSSAPTNQVLTCLWGILASTQRSYFFTILGGVLAFYWSVDGTTFSNLTSTYTPSVGSWLYLSVSRVGGNLTLYVNGASVATVANSANFYDSPNPLAIGDNLESFTSFKFGGKCSHLKIYKGTGLTTSEILAEYNTQKAYYGY